MKTLDFLLLMRCTSIFIMTNYDFQEEAKILTQNRSHAHVLPCFHNSIDVFEERIAALDVNSVQTVTDSGFLQAV